MSEVSLSAFDSARRAAGTARDAESESTVAAAFVDQHYEAIHAWLWWLTRSRESAADLTQETFAAFWESQRRGLVRDPVPWLYQIARNLWRKRAASERRHGGGVDRRRLKEEESERASERSERDERTERIASALGALSPALREALLLRHTCDHSYAVIASILAIPQPLARWRVHRACMQLREALRSSDHA